VAVPSTISGQVGFTVETTAGTRIAPTKFAEVLSENLTAGRKTLRSQAIGGGGAFRKPYALLGQEPGGQIVMEAAAENIVNMFRLCFGNPVTTGAGPYCVDEDTEILTENGWRRYDQVRPGDQVLTYNVDTGMAEWQPTMEVCVFPAEPRTLTLMEGKAHSSLSTPNHRWPVETMRGWQHNRRMVREWRTTETLGILDAIPSAAPLADLPTEQKYGDAFVELIAWFWTEGTIRETGAVKITQSHVVNPALVDRIRGVLREVFGPPHAAGDLVSPLPRWREYVDGSNVRFVLNKAAGALLTHIAPDRVPTFEFLRSLTVAQLALYIDVSMLADNCGPSRLAQKDARQAEAFQFACILAGFNTSIRARKGGAWVVGMNRRTRHMPIAAARQGKEFTITQVEHDGIVWCPRTPNMTWYARRNGTCYFTGNTHTFNWLLTNPLPTATFQVGRTSMDGTVRPFDYIGMMVSTWELGIAPNEYVKMTYNLAGRRAVTDQTLATPTWPTLTPFYSVHATLSILGSTECFDAFTLSGDNKLDISDVVCGTNPGERRVRQAGGPDIKGSFGQDFEDMTMYNAFVNGTTGALTLTLSAPPSSVTITGRVQYIEDNSPALAGADQVLKQTIPFAFVRDAANTDAQTFQVVVVTSTATA
jgi:hypothetical protein